MEEIKIFCDRCKKEIEFPDGVLSQPIRKITFDLGKLKFYKNGDEKYELCLECVEKLVKIIEKFLA